MFSLIKKISILTVIVTAFVNIANAYPTISRSRLPGSGYSTQGTVNGGSYNSITQPTFGGSTVTMGNYAGQNFGYTTHNTFGGGMIITHTH